MSHNQLFKNIEELENSSLKITIDNINFYVLHWKVLSNNNFEIDYITFNKNGYSPIYENKLKEILGDMLKQQIKETKWYRVLFSKICVVIKNIREKFFHF